jgi:hypothetical protein
MATAAASHVRSSSSVRGIRVVHLILDVAPREKSAAVKSGEIGGQAESCSPNPCAENACIAVASHGHVS